MAKASKKRGKKKAAKSAKKKSKAKTPAKRKGAKRKPAKKTPARRAPQAEPWPVIFAVLLAVTFAVVAGWHFNGAAEAAAVLGSAFDAHMYAQAGACSVPQISPLALSAPLPQLH